MVTLKKCITQNVQNKGKQTPWVADFQGVFKNNIMKKVIILMLLMITSCKTTEKKMTQHTTADVLLTYSKSGCLGKCPVYDVKILKDGMLVYTGVDWVRQRGNVIIKLSSEELAELKGILDNTTEEPRLFKRVRDRPVTVLRIREKKYEFHDSQAEGQLKAINSKIEHWVDQVNAE